MRQLAVLITALALLFSACATHQEPRHGAAYDGKREFRHQNLNGKNRKKVAEAIRQETLATKTTADKGDYAFEAAEVDEAPAPEKQQAYSPAPQQTSSGYGTLGDASGSDGGYGSSYGYGDAGAEEKPEPIKPLKEGEELVVYTAELSLTVEQVTDTLERVKSFITQTQGRIERLETQNSGQRAYLTLRVPVEKFETAMQELEKMGAVTARSVYAEDVTEAYSDTALKLETMKKILQRFEAILAKTSDPKERVGILAEIERLTAEITALERQLVYLRDQASFSTIILTLQAAAGEAARTYIPSPFMWLRYIGPDGWPELFLDDIACTVPAGFFSMREEFQNRQEQYLFATPQSGVRARIGWLLNYPYADAAFWNTALNREMDARQYKKLPGQPGTYTSKVFTSEHISVWEINAQRRYLVGTAVANDRIIVLEVLFESAEAYTANIDTIKKFIESVEVQP